MKLINAKSKLLLLVLTALFIFALTACVPPTTPDGDEPDNTSETPYTDETTLDRDYQGKDFFTDGVGPVTLVSAIDGDTAIFRSSTHGTFTVRFLGIDTPESTYKLEPWGKAASSFTAGKLQGAQTIVLETEAPVPEVDSTGDRYLAWVWVDGRLLNLELVEQCFTSTKGLTGSKYADIFYDADLNAAKKKIRIRGTEQDPNFDYSLAGIEKTLEDLRKNPMEQGIKVRVQGIVSRIMGIDPQERCGTSAYIQEQNANGEWYGVYVYGGFDLIKGFKVGNGVVIEGSTGSFNEAFQITDTRNTKVIVTSMGHILDPVVVTADQLNLSTNPYIENVLVKLQNVTVVDGYDSTELDPITNADKNDGFTLEVRTADGKTVNVRVDNNTLLRDEQGNKITTYQYFMNKTMNIVGVVGKYYDNFQIMLLDQNDIQYLS